MKCPACNADIGIVRACPVCGKPIQYGGNTVIFQQASLSKLSWRDIFSETFRRHHSGDTERVFRSSFRSQADALSQWQKPWLFSRVFLILLLIALFMMKMFDVGFLPTFLYPFVMIGSTLVPLTLLILLWELNILRHIAFHEVLLLVLVGSLFSITSAAIINTRIGGPAIIAPFTEEPIKLLVAVAFMGIKKKPFSILDGLVIGAAAGCGFELMETLQYTVTSEYLLLELLNRGFSAFWGHVLYTAPFVGALCWVMNGEPFRLGHLVDVRFLLFFGLGMGMHLLQNSATLFFQFRVGLLFISFNNIVQLILLWAALLFLVNLGFRQVLQKSTGHTIALFDQSSKALPSEATASLVCNKGPLQGARVPLEMGKPVIIGRDPSACGVVLSSAAKGISRAHCKVTLTGAGVLLRDMDSTYGTFGQDGRRLPPGQDVFLANRESFSLANGSNVFEVQM